MLKGAIFIGRTQGRCDNNNAGKERVAIMLSEQSEIRRQVLVVDDEVINRQLLGFIISRDYDVIYAQNGREALGMIS